MSTILPTNSEIQNLLNQMVNLSDSKGTANFQQIQYSVENEMSNIIDNPQVPQNVKDALQQALQGVVDGSLSSSNLEKISQALIVDSV